MKVHCPKCKGELEVKEVDPRRTIACIHCGTLFNLFEKDTMMSATQSDFHESFSPTFPEELGIGHNVNGYLLEKKLGSGGMGTVFLGTQLSLGRKVAVKVLSKDLTADPAFIKRFDRESHALSKLNHPNIVSIIDKGIYQGFYYFIMEYVDGISLRTLMEQNRIPPKEALKIVPQICDALEYAHTCGVVHRDIKPENILITRDGTVKIADFGLARVLGGDPALSRITKTNIVMGTMEYMAPEQRESSKDVDHRADIYSLGVVFYEMLTGELPIGRFAPPSRKNLELNVNLDRIVLKVLEKDPELRYQRASHLGTDVKKVSRIGKEPSGDSVVHSGVSAAESREEKEREGFHIEGKIDLGIDQIRNLKKADFSRFFESLFKGSPVTVFLAFLAVLLLSWAMLASNEDGAIAVIAILVGCHVMSGAIVSKGTRKGELNPVLTLAGIIMTFFLSLILLASDEDTAIPVTAILMGGYVYQSVLHAKYRKLQSREIFWPRAALFILFLVSCGMVGSMNDDAIPVVAIFLGLLMALNIVWVKRSGAERKESLSENWPGPAETESLLDSNLSKPPKRAGFQPPPPLPPRPPGDSLVEAPPASVKKIKGLSPLSFLTFLFSIAYLAAGIVILAISLHPLQDLFFQLIGEDQVAAYEFMGGFFSLKHAPVAAAFTLACFILGGAFFAGVVLCVLSGTLFQRIWRPGKALLTFASINVLLFAVFAGIGLGSWYDRLEQWKTGTAALEASWVKEKAVAQELEGIKTELLSFPQTFGLARSMLETSPCTISRMLVLKSLDEVMEEDAISFYQTISSHRDWVIRALALDRLARGLAAVLGKDALAAMVRQEYLQPLHDSFRDKKPAVTFFAACALFSLPLEHFRHFLNRYMVDLPYALFVQLHYRFALVSNETFVREIASYLDSESSESRKRASMILLQIREPFIEPYLETIIRKDLPHSREAQRNLERLRRERETEKKRTGYVRKTFVF